MAKTPKEYNKNLKEGIITEKMLEECLYSVNKRAKNYRDKEREYREYNRNARHYCRYYYDKYDNEEQMKNKKEMFYEQKEIMLSILQPTCIHKEFLGYEKERIYDYDDRYINRRKYNKENKIVWENRYYDYDEDREVYFFDIKTDKARHNYYLFYELGDRTFHSPIVEEDLNKYDYLEVVEIDHLETEGHDINDLLSCQFCSKVVELIKSGNFVYDNIYDITFDCELRKFYPK